MNKRISRLLAFLIVFAMVFSMMPMQAHAWSMSKKPNVSTDEEKVRSSYKYKGEWYEVSTPADEPYWVYVKGKTRIPTRMLAILPTKTVKGKTIRPFRIFVIPSKSGYFHVRVYCKPGSTKPAEALPFSGSTGEPCCTVLHNTHMGKRTWAPLPIAGSKKIFQDVKESDWKGTYRLNIGRWGKGTPVQI